MVNTPPADRRPILTYVGEHDPAAVSEALRRELLREGQAFYVHNRVSDIERVAREIRDLVPEARVAIAHGQMDEGSLEKVVLDFWERRYDVLVCTTIIESGIDMPSVNTLIVDRADLLGLGQLHQIRGRVGRGGQRAYAYLFHPADRVLSEQAYERLRTIGEHTELGLGLQDRHARPRDPGRGQPARARTSRATSRRSATTSTSSWWPRRWPRPGARPGPAPPTVSIDVPGDAHLPKDYVAAEDARLEAYRRLAAATTHGRGRRHRRRVGRTATARCPPPAEGLLALARLRAGAMARGIGEIAMSSVRPAGTRQPVVRLSPVTLPASAAGAAAPSGARRDLPGGRGTAPGARSARAEPRGRRRARRCSRS